MERLLTASEAAARLGVAPKTIYAWASRPVGQRPLPSVRLGERLVRFRVEDLEAFIAAGRVPPDQQTGAAGIAS
jgi:excisionase family DNA binding protein